MIVSQPEHLVVDNGMTISLPCLVDQIPGEASFVFVFHLTNFHSFLGQFPPSASLTKYHFHSARFSNPDIARRERVADPNQFFGGFDIVPGFQIVPVVPEGSNFLFNQRSIF